MKGDQIWQTVRIIAVEMFFRFSYNPLFEKGKVIMKYKILLLLAIHVCSLNTAFALSDAFSKPENGIFSTYEIARFQLKAPFTTLFKAKKLGFFGSKRVNVDGVISYLDETQKLISLRVQLHIKGFTSTEFCTFPKLELIIPKSESINTVFQGIKAIDLNTHCVEQDDPSTAATMQYIKSAFNNHREAMIYRIMDILNMPSFRARPILIQYTDTDEKSETLVKQNFEYQAFFLEDYADFRKKNKLKAIRGVNDVTKSDTDINDLEKLGTYVFSNVADSPNVDLDDAARSALLQFFIGNGDWFLQTTKTDKRYEGQVDGENLWNMKIVEDANGRWITIPQDFNFSMFMQNFPLVEPINSKVFDLAPAESKIAMLESFIAKKAQIYEAIRKLDSTSSEQILFRLDRVYIEMEKLLKQLKAL
jgi:hypothetical protein